VLVNAITQTNPKCNEQGYESNYAKSEVTCLTPFVPHGHYECVNGENLVSCTLVF
jgi:hypothetical protein